MRSSLLSATTLQGTAKPPPVLIPHIPLTCAIRSDSDTEAPKAIVAVAMEADGTRLVEMSTMAQTKNEYASTDQTKTTAQLVAPVATQTCSQVSKQAFVCWANAPQTRALVALCAMTSSYSLLTVRCDAGDGNSCGIGPGPPLGIFWHRSTTTVRSHLVHLYVHFVRLGLSVLSVQLCSSRSPDSRHRWAAALGRAADSSGAIGLQVALPSTRLS